MTQIKGVVAAGHEQTAKAAEQILHAGGNAFDAVVAAHLAACVVEPVLSSLAGGGFLLAHTASTQNTLYDFFVQTPIHPRAPADTDFFPIFANFGNLRQEFHIGLGAIATPGTVKGLHAIHHDLCSIPMATLAEPAIELARNGVAMNAFQAYIFDIIKAIYLHSPDTRDVYGSTKKAQSLITEGELLRQPKLADFIECLVQEGDALFYQGDIAESVSQLCTEAGGHLTLEDFRNYQVRKRKPLNITYRQATLLSNPAPSSGGTLIAFAMKLLEKVDLGQYTFGSAAYLDLLAQIQGITDKARVDAYIDKTTHHPGEHLLASDIIASYRSQIKAGAFCSRGTTHISIMDQRGNMASLTTSNGEGCGHFIPGTGVMLNNMLGEEDLNPHGFHCWPPNQRMTSMMAPSIVFLPNDKCIVSGSGGSNRLRTAILQVLINLIDFDMPLQDAVSSPRIHFEKNDLSVEGGFDPDEIKKLITKFPKHTVLQNRNLFFGGTHSVYRSAEEFKGVGDPRRGGVTITVY